MKGFLLAVALLAAGIPHEAGEQDRLAATPLKTALADLDRLVPTRTLATAPAGRPEPDRLRAAVDWLNRNYEKTNPDNVSDEYVRTLQRAGTLLSAQPSAEMIEDVTLELETKVDHCKRLSIGMGGSVRLRVNTVRAAQIVSDWQVLYLLKFDEWLKTPPRNFPRVSSPTETSVEPGRYWVWARDPATGKTSQPVLAEVAGKPELVLDLPVP
jgi:hypothetical protein